MSITPKEHQKREERIKALVKEIGENTDAVDELVHEAKSEEAAAINNQGLEDQIRYLIDSWGMKETDKVLCGTLGLKPYDDRIHHVVCDSKDQHIKCLRCGKSEPMPLPMEVRAWVEWSQEWTEPHRDCKEKPCPEESAGGGAPPSTGPSSSSTPS